MVGVNTYLLGLAHFCSCRSGTSLNFKVGVSFYVGGRVFSYGYTGMLFFIWRGSSRSYPCSGEERYGCRLQILCGDRSDCECHFLIIAASRCPVSYAAISCQDTYLLWQLLHTSKPLVYTLYNAWIERYNADYHFCGSIIFISSDAWCCCECELKWSLILEKQ